MSHLKSRLERETSPEVRTAAAHSLRRHAIPEDDLAGWWWRQDTATWQWFVTASQLGLLGGLHKDQEAMVSTFLGGAPSTTSWATQMLHDGGYSGSSDSVLEIVRGELNDGAGDVLHAAHSTSPIGRMIVGAAVAALRSTSTTDSGNGTSSRTRVRRKEEKTVLASIVAATEYLRVRPDKDASDGDWQQRLIRVAQAWGDGWVLRQAVATVPAGINLTSIATAVRSQHEVLAATLETDAGVRQNRGETVWWRDRYKQTDSELGQRHWAVSLLTCAHTSVVVDLASDLNTLVDEVSPKHFRAMRETIRAFRKLSVGRDLHIRDPLRLNQVDFTPRVLWLARATATDSSVEQIDKRLVANFEPLVAGAMGDMRELVRVIGASKAIKFDTLDGARSVLPIGGWASDIKLGAMRKGRADAVLRTPERWPGDLVQRAVQAIEDRLATDLSPISVVAETDGWFADD